MAERISCCVPFCRRTRKPGCREWICHRHWMAIPMHIRRRKYKLDRLYRHLFGDQFWGAFPGGSPKRLMAVKLDRLCLKAWNRCKRVAIEKAAGI
ncbi:hypothetical protein EOA37_09630 [Mesorhizobium sp. M2A.F.Ca.ET.015.02.1.1]|uniref:hypothetical protein n=1 Tax=Mesorhizobium sp. M2A.F.Ca.ET.015.02.1.1 TaxID=2496758 RepID=UPI000FC9B5D6|nr:hypothetical protein [Mesorhizobium sp. M2A.F.Ca.ET.015.02.1.1]RUW41512.1 hypothetical protein EOA37_09630 [Mesorhizobium sp. M2A.F.Ca.ET.015.02.1.1]